MIIDFAAARKRLLARPRTELDSVKLNTLVNRLAEEKAADLRAIEARKRKKP